MSTKYITNIGAATLYTKVVHLQKTRLNARVKQIPPSDTVYVLRSTNRKSDAWEVVHIPRDSSELPPLVRGNYHTPTIVVDSGKGWWCITPYHISFFTYRDLLTHKYRWEQGETWSNKYVIRKAFLGTMYKKGSTCIWPCNLFEYYLHTNISRPFNLHPR
jgi:hypothetical protein